MSKEYPVGEGDYVLPDALKDGNRMGWGKKPALLVLDACKGWWTEDSPISLLSNAQATGVPDRIKTLVAAARKAGIPIYWTMLEFRHPDMLDAGFFYKKAKWLDIWQKDDPRKLYEYPEGLGPEGDDVVYKHQAPSSFFGTTLDASLNGLGVDTILICGASTSGSVRPTALEGAGRGFRPIVVSGCCADKTDGQRENNLFDVAAKYGDVISLPAAVEILGSL